MGKGKKRHRDVEAAKDGSDDEISVEEGDIEALARSSLNAGESILGQGRAAEAPVESRGICHAPLILQKLQDIEYKVPGDAKRVPWVDTLAIDGWKEVPKDIKAKDGVKLEGAFLELANDSVKEAYRRLKVMKVPSSRPTDFYAEMLRTDSQMFKVRERASEEQRRMKIVETRKQSQAAKKFAKNVRVKRIQERAGDKNKTLDEIAAWRSKSKEDRANADENDLDDILDKQSKGKKGPQISGKQAAKDKKYGYGGKKKYAKSGTRESTNDIYGENDRGGKGKGKGKGGGGKGGGKGKGLKGGKTNKRRH